MEVINNQNQKPSDKTTIIQDTRIIQAIISKFPEHGNQINVIHIGQIIESKGNNSETKSFNLWSFLEELPQPRLKNLYDMVISMSLEKCGTQEKAAAFLGVTRRVINHNLYKRDKLLKNVSKK